MTEEERVREPGLDGVPDARARPLLTDLVNELSVSPSGVAFIASCLDRLVAAWDLREAQAVLNDAVLGLQLFNAGRRPFELETVEVGGHRDVATTVRARCCAST
jgi:hypothetical protein